MGTNARSNRAGIRRPGSATLWVILTLVAVALVVGVMLFRGRGDSGSGEGAANVTGSPALETNANAAANANLGAPVSDANTATDAAQRFSVEITSSGFSPRTVTIAPGDTVVWTNNSGGMAYPAPAVHPTHRAYTGRWDDDGSGRIADGQTYSFTFTAAGTYHYHDHLHPSVLGTVIVQ